MVNWNEALCTEFGSPAEIVCEFTHQDNTVRIIEVAMGDGDLFTIARDENNEHVQIGADRAYASATVIQNVPPREHKAIYMDGNIDHDWCHESVKNFFGQTVIGYIYKENGRVWVELK